jgi:hypothetical protein
LLRTRHLNHPDVAIQGLLDDLTNAATAAGPAQVPRVLIEQAMRKEDDFPAPLIQEALFQDLGLVGLSSGEPHGASPRWRSSRKRARETGKALALDWRNEQFSRAAFTPAQALRALSADRRDGGRWYAPCTDA